MNFNRGLGFQQGMQDYQLLQSKEEYQKAQLKMLKDQEDLERMKIDAYQQDQSRQRQLAQGGIAEFQSRGMIPPPPQQGGGPGGSPGMPPGQASQPPPQPPQGQGPPPGYGPPQRPPPGMMPQGQQGPPQGGNMIPPQGQQQAPQGPPPIQPYRAMPQPGQGPQGPPPGQQGPQLIPPSPTTQQKNQYDQLVDQLAKQGITDPQVVFQTLQGRATWEQSQQLAQAAARKADLAERHQNMLDEALLQKAQVGASQIDVNEARARKLGLGKSGSGSNDGGLGGAGKGGASKVASGIEAATWDYIIKGQRPPAKMYKAVEENQERIARENGMSSEELSAASADVKTKLLAKRTFETRVQNIGRAENQLNKEIPTMEAAMAKLDLPSIPIAARGNIAALRAMGNPDITTLDQSAEVVLDEFQGIITGNPGTLNVGDVEKAKENYTKIQTPQQMKAWIANARNIIQRAKAANDETRQDIMGGINNELHGKGSDTSGPGKITAASKDDLAKLIKSGKLHKGDTFFDPDGNPHTVN
jgi:hypothetical protein